MIPSNRSGRSPSSSSQLTSELRDSDVTMSSELDSRGEASASSDVKSALTSLNKALRMLVDDVNEQITSTERVKVAAHRAAAAAGRKGAGGARRAAEEAMHVAMALVDKLDKTAKDLHSAQVEVMRALGRTE